MSTKSRSRKRKPTETSTDLPSTPAEAPASVEPVRVKPADDTNVSPFEGTLSVYAGAMLIIAALFPRSFKQILLLGAGAAFLYRGQSRHCHVYSALDIDTNKEGLLKQVSERFVS